MAKVEVQIRSCFCCGLSVGTIFTALYTLFLYSLLTGLAGWGLSDTTSNGDNSHYRSCLQEAQNRVSAENRKLEFHGGHTTVIIEDSSSYHCSFGLYTEELKYEAGTRYSTLVFDLFVYVSMILASIIMLIGLAIYNQWLLVPWIFVMAIDIIRGLISVFFIFWFSYGNLARIATGIFFLGLQFFHISLLLIAVAKFQKMYNRKRGIVDRPYDPRAYPGAASSTYAYSPDGGHAAGGYYPEPHPYPTKADYPRPEHGMPPPHGTYDSHGGYRY